MDWKNMWLGIFLMFVGMILLLAKFDIIIVGWKTLWPLFVLGPGIILEGAFLLNRKIPGVLVPGGILTLTGLNLFVCNLLGWGLMTYLWPVFPLSVAFGLFQLYVFDSHDRGLLIPVGILGVVAGIGFVTTLASQLIGGVIPLLIFAVGVYLFLKGRNQQRISK